MDTGALGRSMRLSVVEGGLATVMGSLFSGVFLTGFALSMGASRLQIGILFALPALCGVAQLAGSYCIERFGNCKRLCLAAALTSRLLYLPVLLVPVVAGDRPGEEKVWWVIGLMAISNALGSFSGVAWLTWIKALIPANVMVPFFGRRNLMNTGLSFVACLAAGILVDYCNGGITSSHAPGFIAVFAIAMLCGLVGLAILARMPAAEPVVEQRQAYSKLLSAPLKEANFRRVVWFYTVWNFAVNVAAPFIPVFLLQKLGLDLWFVIALSTLSSLCGLVANNFWTRMSHRFGIKPIVLVATLGDALLPLWLVFIQAEWSWMLLLVHMLGIFNAPVAMGPDNFVLKLAPAKNASSYMAVFRSFVGPATAIAAILGGWLAGSLGTGNVANGELALGGLKIVFLLSFALRVASLALLWRVAEPNAQTLRYIAKVFQRARRQAIVARARGSADPVILPMSAPAMVTTEPPPPALARAG